MNEQTQAKLKQTTIADEKPKISLAEKLKEKKKAKLKKTIKRTVLFTFLALFSFAVYFLFKPFKASLNYGICRTILELNLAYPHTLYVSEIDDLRDKSIRLWFTHTDAFGEYRMEPFQCLITINPETGAPQIIRITRGKIEFSQNKIRYLNQAMPYFVENPLIVNYPSALPDSLNGLFFDIESARRIQF